VEAVDHLEMTAQILLSEMLQHARINQALHERAAVLRQTKARQPLIAHPLMTHLTIRQALWDHTHAQMYRHTYKRLQMKQSIESMIKSHSKRIHRRHGRHGHRQHHHHQFKY